MVKPLDKLVEEINQSVEISFFSYEVKRKNPRTGKAKYVGTIPCRSGNQDTEEDFDIQEHLIDEIRARWGVGEYSIMLVDADGKGIDQFSKFSLEVEKDGSVGAPKTKRASLIASARQDDEEKITIEALEQERLRGIQAKLREQRVENLQRQIEKESNDDDDDDDNEDDNEEEEQSAIIAQVREDARKEIKEEYERDRIKTDQMADLTKTILTQSGDKSDRLMNMLIAQSLKPQPPPPPQQNSGLGEVVQLITSQQQATAAMAAEQNRIMRGQDRERQEQITNTAAETARSQERSQENMMRLIVEMSRPKPDGTKELISSLLQSPTAIAIINMLKPQESALDKLLPAMMENSANIQTYALKAVAEAISNPPMDPKDILARKLHFLTGIKNMIVGGARDLIESYTSTKEKAQAENAQRIQAETVKRQRAEREKQKQVAQKKDQQEAAAPTEQQAIRQAPEQAIAPQSEDDKLLAEFNCQFAKAREYLSQNYEKPDSDLAKGISEIAPMVIALFCSNKVEYIMSQIGNNLPEGEVRDRFRGIVVYIKEHYSVEK